jgi:hypothetical protein
MKELEEVQQIKELVKICDSNWVTVNELERVNFKGRSYPILSFSIGSQDKEAPCLGLFGGVHGLEKVGTHVIIAWLNSLFKKLKWDSDLQTRLKTSRIVSIPLINPGGMSLHWRSNPNGVDLMRNAPVTADPEGLPFLLSGHNYSNKIPWFRGNPEEKMEIESQAVVDFVKEEMFPSQCAISVDFHSGFGFVDRFWFPYAKTKNVFPKIKEVQALKELLDETHPHHIYSIEPQSNQYTTHGDLWDYLFDQHQEDEKYKDKLYIPWTLEMGSWNWVKKNPKQLLSPLGLFNPMVDHRYDRTMRRHKSLIDFLFTATRNSHTWSSNLPQKA